MEEAKAWWRPTDSLYKFLMQCAGRADGKKALTGIGALLDEKDVYAEFHASFSDKTILGINFRLYSDDGFNGSIEDIVAKGIRDIKACRIRASSTCTGSEGRVYMTKTDVAPAIGIVRLPLLCKVAYDDRSTGKRKEEERLRFRTKSLPEQLGKSFRQAMDDGGQVWLYADNGTEDSQAIFYGNCSEQRKNGIFVRRSSGFFGLLGEKEMAETGALLSMTGYNFRGRLWNVELTYRGEQ